MNSHLKEDSPRSELRERIILEASKAFSTYGIRGITMDEIANSLKISKRTLYEIFADKEMLLKECILYHQAQSEETIKEIIAKADNVLEAILRCYKDSVEIYNKTNLRFFEDLKKYPKVYCMMRDGREADDTVVINFMKQGVEQGLFRDDVNFDILQMMVHEQIKLLMNTEIANKYTFLEIYESIMFIYLRGISTAEGVKKLDEFIAEHRK